MNPHSPTPQVTSRTDLANHHCSSHTQIVIHRRYSTIITTVLPTRTKLSNSISTSTSNHNPSTSPSSNPDLKSPDKKPTRGSQSQGSCNLYSDAKSLILLETAPACVSSAMYPERSWNVGIILDFGRQKSYVRSYLREVLQCQR